MRTRLVAALVVVGASASALSISCGPSCLDDRCSLKPATPTTTRVDYTKPQSTGTVTTGSAAPAPVVAAGSGSGSAAPAPVKPPVAAGSGSAAPAPVTPPPIAAPVSAFWELYSGDQFKMHVASKTAFNVASKVTFEFVKTPAKTPFVITLSTLVGGAQQPEGVWNDCPENKIVCDSGTKTHAVKKAGQVLIQAGINWTVTGLSDEAKGTVVTWTNNLSREVVALRLLK